jgi:hypothetical protein
MSGLPTPWLGGEPEQVIGETPQEHIRNALALLRPSGMRPPHQENNRIIELWGDEYRAAIARLWKAVHQLEGT